MVERHRHVLEYSLPAKEEREERRVLGKQRERWRALRMFPFGDGESALKVMMVKGSFLIVAVLVLCLAPRPWNRIGVWGVLIGYGVWRLRRSFWKYRERFPR